MIAGRLLSLAGLHPGHPVLGLIGGVDVGTVTVRPASTWMRRLWGDGIGAMTLGRKVFIDPALLVADDSSLARVLVHELVHVRQWEDLGSFRFLVRYLGDYLRGRLGGKTHREAYLSIGLEEEARAVVGASGIS